MCVHSTAEVIQNPQITCQNEAHCVARHGWLHMLLHWRLPGFMAHNWLPLSQAPPWHDSLILMYPGKHEPNSNADLHAWVKSPPYRCHLIIPPACTVSWCVNNEPFSSSPPIQASVLLWLMMVASSLLLSLCWFRTFRVSLCAAGRIALDKFLMEILLSGTAWYSRAAAEWMRKLIKLQRLLNS